MSHENKPEQNDSADLERRRKVLRGLAGLPAMATMASGAQAATESNYRCIGKEGVGDIGDIAGQGNANRYGQFVESDGSTPADPMDDLSVSPDTLLEDVFVPDDTDKLAHCVRRDVIRTDADNTGLRTNEHGFYDLGEGTAMRVEINVTDQQQNPRKNYCAVYFDQSGARRSLVRGNDEYLITASCYNSFDGMMR